jgi:DNA-binding NarL/FixJ family response regulator
LLDDIRSLSVRARVEITSGASDAAGNGGGAGRVGGGLDRFRLTPRELEVLRLVADGLGNTDIAARLYISPKTVSVHVSNLIAKLGVGGRGEAAAVAHRLGAFVD